MVVSMNMIKLLITSLFVALAGPAPNTVNSLMLWSDSVNTPGTITNYVLYVGGTTGVYTNAYDMGVHLYSSPQFTNTISGLSRNATYYMAVTAEGLDGSESDYSTEIVVVTPKKPAKPTGLIAMPQ